MMLIMGYTYISFNNITIAVVTSQFAIDDAKHVQYKSHDMFIQY